MPGAVPTHAGVVVFRATEGGPEFLVTTAKRRSQEWVLPKGHIESGETAERTALRELAEETGVTAEIVAPLGITRFPAGGEEVVATFFLARSTEIGPSGEGRAQAWLSFDSARSRLSFEESRDLLDRAREALRQRFRRAGEAG